MSISLFGQVSHTVTFKKDYNVFADLFEDDNLYSQVEWEGLENYNKEGYPVVPVKYIRLIVPYNAKAESVSINKNQAETIKLGAPMLPGQPPIPIAIGVTDPDFIKGQESVYKSGTPYPENSVEIVEENISRGNKIVTLAVFPFQYIPLENQLIFSAEISIELNYSIDKAAKIEKKIKKDNGYSKVLTSMVDNKTDVKKYNTYLITDDADVPTTKALSIVPVCDYVIITPSALVSGFDNFMEWKKLKGIDISLVTTETIYANYSGDLISGIYDNAGKIRQFLNDCYTNGTKYALLGGDYNYVPIRYGWAVYYTTSENVPTDLYFSDFDGDWKVDNDTIYGERSGDMVDWDSEIYVGRLLCTNTSEINNWTNKLNFMRITRAMAILTI
jgi:hypothetical protein